MKYIDIFLDEEPKATAEDIDGQKYNTYPQFCSDPVKVENEDGSYHWHVLVAEEQYNKYIDGKTDPVTGEDHAISISKEEAEAKTVVFSRVPEKYKRLDDWAEFKPRHTFGRKTRDPEITIEKK